MGLLLGWGGVLEFQEQVMLKFLWIYCVGWLMYSILKCNGISPRWSFYWE